MPEGLIDPGPFQLAVAASMILVAGLTSVLLRLGLGRTLLIASVRTVVQLLLVGGALSWVFATRHPLAIAGAATVMVVAAAHAAVGRSSRRYEGARSRALLTLTLVGVVTALMTTRVVLGVRPWWTPQYIIPLLGMLLGNALTGISLALDAVLETLRERRRDVEVDLALGASWREAAAGPTRDAVRRGMIPIINSMMVVGLVSLPGMMTGQILAGADPMVAVKYQIVIMFSIAACTTMGAVGITLLTVRRLFDSAHRLRFEDVERVK